MRRSLPVFLLLTALLSLAVAACLPLKAIAATEAVPATDTLPPSATIVWFPPTATPTPNAFPTATPSPEMNPGIGAQILREDFSDDSVWDTVTSEQASAIIKDRHLTLAVEPGVSVASLRRDMIFGNFYAELTARIGLCRGDDTYGLLLRANGNSFYRFSVTCSGTMNVERIKSSVRLNIHEPVFSADAPPGAPGEVQIGVWASGGEMRFFLNGHYQFNVIEKTFPSGAIGVFIASRGDTPVTITFSDLNVYEVSYVPPVNTASP